VFLVEKLESHVSMDTTAVQISAKITYAPANACVIQACMKHWMITTLIVQCISGLKIKAVQKKLMERLNVGMFKGLLI
jgi:hypothetical protein